jgi:hypothetical protein
MRTLCKASGESNQVRKSVDERPCSGKEREVINKATLVLPLLYGILKKGNTYFFEIPPLLLVDARMFAFKKKRR